jgi:hypothetical protein
VGIEATDFRPHFEGDLVNLFSCIYPGETYLATTSIMLGRIIEMAEWVLDHRSEYASGDQFQLILGWHESVRDAGRQIVKLRANLSSFPGIVDGSEEVFPRFGWAEGLFDLDGLDPHGPLDAPWVS